MGNERMQAVMRDLREAEAILADIEKRRRAPIAPAGDSGARSVELWLKIEKTLAEITEKLKRLTG